MDEQKPVQKWLLSYALISLLGCVHQCSNDILCEDIREIKYSGYNKLRRMTDSGHVLWNYAREVCGYTPEIASVDAKNSLEFLYTYRNGVAHCGVNHGRYCLQVLQEDKETMKICRVVIVYMFLLINNHLNMYTLEEQFDYAICFADLLEVLND